MRKKSSTSPESPATEDFNEVVKLIPQDLTQNRTVEQIVTAFVPQVREEIIEVMGLIPQERKPEFIVEQIIDASVPQIRD